MCSALTFFLLRTIVEDSWMELLLHVFWPEWLQAYVASAYVAELLSLVGVASLVECMSTPHDRIGAWLVAGVAGSWRGFGFVGSGMLCR